jgi:hypothetical protein
MMSFVIGLSLLAGWRAFGQGTVVTVKPASLGVREAILETLKGCAPNAKSVQSRVSKDGRYVMYGSVFGHGRMFALSQLDTGVGVSEWDKGAWEPKEELGLSVSWIRDGAPKLLLGAVRPVDKAFWTLDIAGGYSVAVVAGDVGKYFQTFYLLQFDQHSRNVQVVGPAMQKPYYSSGYVVTFNCSPMTGQRKEWDYFSAQAGQLIHAAQWSDYSSSSNPDDHSTTLRRYDKNGKPVEQLDVEDAFDADHNENYVCTLLRSVPATSPSEANASQARTYAEITIIWPKGEAVDEANFDWAEAYVFEKLTGIPRNLFSDDATEKNWPKVEDLATVKVKGDAKAVARLSPRKS